MIDLNEENCRALTGSRLDLKDVMSVVGILHLHDYEECKKEFYAIYEEGDIIRVEFASPIINKVEVVINLAANIISLYLLDKNDDFKSSISLPFILCMTRSAQRLGFKYVSLHAVREAPKFDGDRGMFGYNVWGKLGFKMTKLDEINRFKDWAASKDHPIEMIHEVYANEQSKSDWKNDGFGWFGNFFLEEGSQSWKILNAFDEEVEKENQRKLLQKMNGGSNISETEKAPRIN